MNYDQVVVQLGGEGHFVPAQFYFDDIELLDDPISIGEVSEFNLMIYPNPATDILRISGNEKLSRFEMFNITGQKVIHLNEVPGQIAVNNLPDGIYTIVASGFNGEQFITKVLVN